MRSGHVLSLQFMRSVIPNGSYFAFAWYHVIHIVNFKNLVTEMT